MTSYSAKAIQLVEQQAVEWEMAAKNYNDLSKVVVKTFDFAGFSVKVQFNPGRIRSSAAKVDKKSLAERPCFLCKSNRPEQQREIPVLGNYDILVNPFPIFPKHLTIVEKSHVDQIIDGRVGEMLELAQLLDEFTIFYNGPKCGASAPDHFHFQAGIKNFMPVDSEISLLKKQYGKLIKNEGCEVWTIDDGVRKLIVFNSTKVKAIENEFKKVYDWLEIKTEETEPMLNIHANYQNNEYQLIMFLRGAHRPWQFFEEGEKNITVTPASVEFGGVLITPLEKDFEKLNKNDIASIYQQVSINHEKFNELVKKLLL